MDETAKHHVMEWLSLVVIAGIIFLGERGRLVQKVVAGVLAVVGVMLLRWGV